MSAFGCPLTYAVQKGTSALHPIATATRLLVPKGRFALSWWDGLSKNRINGIFFEAINELGIGAPGALPAGPAVDRFSDPDQFAAILRAAGFKVVGIRTWSTWSCGQAALVSFHRSTYAIPPSTKTQRCDGLMKTQYDF
jgi:hypothetical protein